MSLEESDWEISNTYQDTFYKHRYFGKYKYQIIIFADYYGRSIHFHVGVASGKKRKDLDLFETKDNKSLGGIKALLWIKQEILGFPEYYKEKYNTSNSKLYLCIEWSDSRRREIYSRLEKEGFLFQIIQGQKTLIKEV